MFSMKETRCYYITPLLNAILITVVHYGSFNSDTFRDENKYKNMHFQMFHLLSQVHMKYYKNIESPLYIVRLRKIVELAYMISKNNCTFYLNNLDISNVRSKIPRSADNIQIPRFNIIIYGNRTITYIALLLWNILSGEMKASRTLSTFEKKS